MDKNQESFSGVIYYTVSYNVKSAILINASSEIILKQDHPLLISNCDSKMSVYMYLLKVPVAVYKTEIY